MPSWHRGVPMIHICPGQLLPHLNEHSCSWIVGSFYCSTCSTFLRFFFSEKRRLWSHSKNVAPLAMDTLLVVVEVGLLAFAKMEWNKGMKWKFPVRLMAAGAPAACRTCGNQTSQRWNSKPLWRRHLFSRHFYGIHLPTDIFIATLQRTFSLSCMIPSIAALAAATLRWRYLGKKRTYIVSRTWRNRHLNVWPIVIFDGEGSICSHLSYYQTTELSTLARPPEIKSPTSMTLGHTSMANMLNYHI